MVAFAFPGINIVTTTRRGVGVALAFIVAIGFALRAFHLGTASLWNDELFTRFYPQLGVAYMWTDGFDLETTPPVYYTLLAGWTHLFGTSPAALRWPSVIFSTLTIPLVFVLGRDLSGYACGLTAALIFAVAPMEIYYAQEARAYALLLLPTGFAMVGVARFLSAPISARGSIGYSAAIVLAVYVHNVSAFLAAATAIIVALDLLTNKRLPAADRRRAILRWTVANGVAAVLCVPELIAMLSEVRTDQLHWMLPMALWDVRYAVSVLVAGPATTPLLLASVLAGVLGVACLAALLCTRMDRRAVTVLIAIPSLDFALIVAAGLRQPLLVPRLMCWMWIPLAVLLAMLLLQRGRARVFPLAASGAVFAVGLGFQLMLDETVKEPWGLLLPRVEPLIARADLVVTGPWTQPMALAHHGTVMTKVRHWDEDLPPTIESVAIRDLLRVRPINRDELAGAIRAGKRVLLIQRNVEFEYRALLKGLPEPREEIIQHCWAGDCLSATYWGDSP